MLPFNQLASDFLLAYQPIQALAHTKGVGYFVLVSGRPNDVDAPNEINIKIVRQYSVFACPMPTGTSLHG